MQLGKHQQEIMAVLQDGGELVDEGNMWSVTLLDEGTQWSGRVPAASAKGLVERGLVVLVSREKNAFYSGGYRAVYKLAGAGAGVPQIGAGESTEGME